jgi:hypothetical protein
MATENAKPAPAAPATGKVAELQPTSAPGLLVAVLNRSLGASADRRAGRIREVARRRERQTASPQGRLRINPSLRTEQRQASRDHLNQEVRTQHRHQYAMARRTFQRLQQEILRDGRYLGSSALLAEYSYWNVYFHSATSMDSDTFRRFTLWHSRITQSARGSTRPSTAIARRPDWRTLSEMLRVCAATATESEPSGASLTPPVLVERKQLLSVGIGVVPRHLGRRRVAPASRVGRILARIRALL